MMRAPVFTFAILLAFAQPGLAARKKPDPKPPMHALAAEIFTLEKFLLSEADFSNPKNEKIIAGAVDSMRRHVAPLDDKKGPFGDDPALRANAAQLGRHLGDASRSFKSGD